MPERSIGETVGILIDYMHANHMPLPHYAEKVLEQCDHGIALMVHFTWGEGG
jgi:hypothetical protein